MPATKDVPEREQITLLLDSGDLRTTTSPAAANIRFSDPKLQRSSRIISRCRRCALRREAQPSTSIRPAQGARDVSASYIIPSPVWKSSYRLIFDGAAQPTLEGWAIVDNTTGEDWTNVQMSLVSGKPISFISALYEPKYMNG